MTLTDKQIADLETEIQKKLETNRKERSILNEANGAIQLIKMKPREEVTQEEVVEVKEVRDENDKILKEGSPAVRKETKTVYDVMPKDPIIKDLDLTQQRREDIFASCKKTVNTLK